MSLLLEQPDLESSTDEYAGRFSGGVGGYFLDVQWQTVASMLPPPHNCRVLDVGGGHAQFAPQLVDQGYDVTIFGSDNSCVQRLDREVGADRYRFVAGNLLELPLASKSFDVVLAFRLLPHLINWRIFVGEICRVAAGVVIVDYPDLRSANWLANKTFAVKKMVEHNTREYRCFECREIVSAFKSNGFHVFKKRRQFLLPMAVHRMCRCVLVSRCVESLSYNLGLSNLFGSPMVIRAERTNELTA